MTLQDFLLLLHPPPDRPINRMRWYFPLCFLSVVVASALRSRKLRIVCTVPILALFSRFHSSYTAEPKVEYPLGLWLMWAFIRYIDISLIGANDKMWRVRTFPQVQFGNGNSDGKVKAREYLREGSFSTRLIRSFSLWTTLRGVGWNWEVKHMKIHGGSRISFLLSALLKTVSAKIILDLMSYLHWRLPYGGPNPRIDLSQAPLSQQLALTWLPLLQVLVGLSFLYWLAALIFVGLFIHEPRDWPYLFGDLSEAYTVGQAWSRTWHQTFRRVCTFLVAPLTEFLGVPERTSLHRNITLVVGFTISGIIHYSGTCNLQHSPNHEKFFLFFAFQALAIMFEDAIMGIGRRLGLKPSSNFKTIGCIWTVAWTTYSFRVYYLRGSLEDIHPIADIDWIERIVKYIT